MDALFEFFHSLGEWFLNIGEFVVSFFKDLIYLVTVTGQILAQIPSYFAFLPSEFVIIIVALFGVVVLYKVLGREG